jgi:NAD+ synthase (glutamine-hydrolysing)
MGIATEVAPTKPPDQSEELYTVIATGLRDYVRKNGFTDVVFGLSGGIDSSLVLALAVDALGAEHVHTVMMPSRHTSGLSIELAQEQAVALGVDHRCISIEPAYEALLTLLGPSFHGLAQDVTEENLQARVRGNIVMALSNKFGWLPLATSNKSELAVGYSTIYGDMCGGFSPLKDCLKTRVYDLCRWRNTVSPAVPEAVIERAPSAELRPDQFDADSLPPYEGLDQVLHRFVDEDWSIRRIVADGFDEAMVRRVAGLVLINEYKRRQGAPGTRITSRGFGRDRRYPITSGWREAP